MTAASPWKTGTEAEKAQRLEMMRTVLRIRDMVVGDGRPTLEQSERMCHMMGIATTIVCSDITMRVSHNRRTDAGMLGFLLMTLHHLILACIDTVNPDSESPLDIPREHRLTRDFLVRFKAFSDAEHKRLERLLSLPYEEWQR